LVQSKGQLPGYVKTTIEDIVEVDLRLLPEGFMFHNTDNLRTDEIFLKLEKTSDGDPEKNVVPAYHFKICRTSDGVEVGYCDFRIGHNQIGRASCRERV
jgi:hypothetical protein